VRAACRMLSVPGWRTGSKPIRPAPADSLPPTQVSLLRAPLPDTLRHDVLAAVSAVAAYTQAHRALVAAGAEAAVEALLARGAAAPPPAARGAAPTDPMPSIFFGPDVEWADVERAARQALLAIREPALADAAPAVPDGSPRCDVCGECAAPGPLGSWPSPGCGVLKRCGGCHGPERWCSKECQRESWLGGHREVCRQRQAAAASAVEAAAAPAGI
jgi:hypothetical protein